MSLSFHLMDSGAQTQDIRHDKYLYQLSHLASLVFLVFFFFINRTGSHCVAKARLELLSTIDLPDSSGVEIWASTPCLACGERLALTVYIVFHPWASVSALSFEVRS